MDDCTRHQYDERVAERLESLRDCSMEQARALTEASERWIDELWMRGIDVHKAARLIAASLDPPARAAGGAARAQPPA